MNKKLIAVAVAGALGAPGVALAQASTVQIYGTIILNYNYADSGSGIPKVDAFNAHDANLGFKGEENLGGGLTAWFQCESTVDISGSAASNQTVNTATKTAITSQAAAWCGRNSAFGLKGAFGNVYAGIWDTPMKTVMGNFRPFSTSGAYGMGLMWNEAASAVPNPTQVGQFIPQPGTTSGSTVTSAAGTVALGGTSAGTSFTRRQNNLWSYWTPVMNGFSAGFSISDSKEGLLQNNTTTPSKPRMWGLGGQYTNGPLILGVGYERHTDYNPGAMLPAGSAAAVNSGVVGASNQVAAATTRTYLGGKDTAFNLGAAYTFANNFKLSALYTKTKYSMDTVAGGNLTGAAIVSYDLSRTAWGIFGDWAIQGPHRLRGEYVQAGNTSGSYDTSIGNWRGNAGAGDTGSKLYGLQYAYAFSKRTELNFGYATIRNDRLAQDRLQTLAVTNTGQNQSAWVLGTKHTF